MPNSCGNAVDRLRLTRGQAAALCTLSGQSSQGWCVQPTRFTLFRTQIVLGSTHTQTSQFTAVISRLVPTIHRPYKDNNKVYK